MPSRERAVQFQPMRCQTAPPEAAPPEAAPPEAAPPEAVAPEGAASEVVTSRAGNLRAVQFQVWDVPTLRTRLDEVVAVYRAAFLDVYERDPDRAAAERRVHARTHLERPGVRAVAALAPATPVPPAELVGFAYGHPGRDGQWWHDVVTRSVPPTVARTWFGDCFEVVELHVLPDWQGRGIGRTLLRMLLSQARTETAALSALAGPDTRARRLYDSEQFHPLHDRFRFPGSPTEYAILVKRLRPASRHDARDGAPAAALS